MKTQFHYLSANELSTIVSMDNCIIITDKNVHRLYESFFKPYKKIVLDAGENEKSFETMEYVVEQLIKLQADRTTTLIGVGGGAVSDLCGFAASIYMRGVPFGFVPTTLLAQVDASIGGKNGVNFGNFKNLLGVIRQPDFILIDAEFLNTLPDTEYSSGLAEIVKYGMIYDRKLFNVIRDNADDIINRKNKSLLETITQRCSEIKKEIVDKDEFEAGERKILNFGHTIGHAIERIENIPHGFAVSIGMMAACRLSESYAALNPGITSQLQEVLIKFNLPVVSKTDTDIILSNLKMDKKRKGGSIDFILLKDIAEPVIISLDYDQILSFQKA